MEVADVGCLRFAVWIVEVVVVDMAVAKLVNDEMDVGETAGVGMNVGELDIVNVLWTWLMWIWILIWVFMRWVSVDVGVGVDD